MAKSETWENAHFYLSCTVRMQALNITTFSQVETESSQSHRQLDYPSD